MPLQTCLLRVPRRSFGHFGVVSYYRRFVRGFAHVAPPLHQFTGHQAEFKWDSEAGKASVTLKNAVTKTPVLVLPDMSNSFVVYAEASKHAVGAVLTQKDEEGKEHPTQLASRTLQVAEKGYSTFEQEAFAVIFALKKFRP